MRHKGRGVRRISSRHYWLLLVYRWSARGTGCIFYLLEQSACKVIRKQADADGFRSSSFWCNIFCLIFVRLQREVTPGSCRQREKRSQVKTTGRAVYVNLTYAISIFAPTHTFTSKTRLYSAALYICVGGCQRTRLTRVLIQSLRESIVAD